MVALECSCTHREGVTLVTASLSIPEEPTRVTVRNRLDGPVLPPRCEGRPEAGWNESGYERVLEPGTHALGYAVAAPPASPPAVVADATPVAGADGTAYTAADIVRELGDPSPPADAVPTRSESDERAVNPDLTDALPDDVADWLDAVASRIERAERLAGDSGSAEELVTAADERMLRELAHRAERLADRRAAVETHDRQA